MTPLLLAADGPELLRRILARALDLGARRILLQPGARAGRVLFLLDGGRREHQATPRRLHEQAVEHLATLVGQWRPEDLRRFPQDGSLHARCGERILDAWVSTVPGQQGPCVRLVFLHDVRFLVGLDRLGMEPSLQRRFERNLARRGALILVSGPTGSGRSSTLYSALERLAAGGNRLVASAEFMIHRRLEGVLQLQVDRRLGMDMPGCLDAIERAGADVCMVADALDSHSLTPSAELARAGKLVLVNMPGWDPWQALGRIFNYGVDHRILEGVPLVVLNQRLLRRLCPDCCQPSTLPPGALRALGIGDEERFPGDSPGAGWRRARPGGCEACRGRGVAGRTGVFTLLELEYGMRGLHPWERSSVLETPGAWSSLSLRRAALRKALGGEVSLEEVLATVGLDIPGDFVGEAVG